MENLFKKIKLIALDVDGVLTDGKKYYGVNGLELLAFDTRDGYGIVKAIKAGLHIALITGTVSKIIQQRAMDLGVKHLYSGNIPKCQTIQAIQKDLTLSPQNTMYVGDDELDISAYNYAAIKAAPSNAHPEVLKSANFVTSSQGGNGAVRELIDLILKNT